jgi:type VI secretion system protein ImpM
MGDSRVAAVPVRDLIAMQALEAGFYGKLPSHGDFLRRRVSDAFLGVWDGWLQRCMAASRSALG